MKKVAVIMGSDSDLPVVAPAIKQLRELSIETEVHVMSAHRTPKEAMAFAESARENGFGVILAAAVWRRTWRCVGRFHHAAGDWHSVQCQGAGRYGRHAGYGDDAPRVFRWLPLGSMRQRTQRCWQRKFWLWAMTT